MFSLNNISEESDVSDSFVNIKSSFRVSVGLQRYFDDVRARCYVLVTRTRRVHWLQERLRKLFRLPGAFCLCANGHLLPPAEPLGLLCPDDRIEVIPLQDDEVKVLNNGDHLNKNKCKESKDGKVHLLSSTPSFVPHFVDTDRSCPLTTGPIERPVVNQHCEDLADNSRNSSSQIENLSCDHVDSVTVLNEDKWSMQNNLAGNLDTDGCVDSEEREERRTLQNYKRRALALLETRGGSPEVAGDEVTKEEAPRRARRRVRRRSRRGITSDGPVESSAAPNGPAEPCAAPAGTADPCVASDGPAEPCAAPAESEQGVVTRNEAMSSRKARLVHSYDVERILEALHNSCVSNN